MVGLDGGRFGVGGFLYPGAVNIPYGREVVIRRVCEDAATL